MRKKIKELYEHSTLVAKIRYSYLCLLVPFVLFLIFCFYNLWNNNRRYEDMINSSVMASQFSLDFQKDFDYETYLLIVGNKTLEESSLHDMLVEADDIVAGLEELTESQENLKRLTSVKKYLNNLETYIGRIEENIREGNRYEDNMEIWENDVQIVTSLVGDTMSQYIYYEIRGIQESRQQYQDFFVNMIRFSIIAFTLILVLFLFLSYYIPLSITSPIRRLTQVTDQVAKGDLTVRSDVTGGMEARMLSDSLNTMIDNINVVYCENDNEAFGAMEAIRAAGKRVGSNLAAGDIMILSFDGVSTESMDCVLKDEITCIGECNPLHGPRVEALIQILEEGRTPEKFSYVEEGLYAHDDTVTAVTVGDETYRVQWVDDEIRNENAY